MAEDIRSRNWCLRLANPLPVECEQQKELFKMPLLDDERLKFARWAFEVGAGGLKHIQAVVVFKQAVRWSFMLANFHGWHFEAKSKHSTLEQFLNYPGKVDKSGSVVWVCEGGVVPVIAGDGQSELEVIHDELKSGVSIDAIWEKHFLCMCRNYRGVYEYYYSVQRYRQREEMKSFREGENRLLVKKELDNYFDSLI